MNGLFDYKVGSGFQYLISYFDTIMEKSNFNLLLERYLTGQVTEEEKTKIEAWLDSTKAKGSGTFVWSKEDEEILFKKITANLNNVDEIVAFEPNQQKVPSIYSNRWLRAAAALLLLAVASYVIWVAVYTKSHILHPTVTLEKMILTDGSIVWLHPKSKLTYREKPDHTERHAELTGEGLFEVAKDASRPFIINCGKITVKVLGTSFDLKAGKDGIELKVLTGRVSLSSQEDKTGIVVEPNKKVIYTGTRGITEITMNDTEVAALTASTEYNMKFSGTAMDKIIGRIEKKFNVHFLVDNKDLFACRITADFTDHSLDNTLQMISEVLDFRYTIEGSTVTVRGGGCK